MAERFYCRGASGLAPLVLEGDEARHLSRVMRLGPGALVEVFDGQGYATAARVVSVGKDRVELSSVGPPLPDRAPDICLTLATAVPKGDRFDWLVEKATELGVSRLVPLITERSVVDPRAAKLDRLRRSVVEACKQCRRNHLMTVDEPLRWAALLNVAPEIALRLVAHPGAGDFGDLVRPAGEQVWLAVGPEGGLTEGEVGAAVAAGWCAVGLGRTVLRVETAALAGAVRVLATGPGQVH